MAMISNISSKYKNIISKCSLIHSGSPAVYELRPKETMFGKLTRQTVGEKCQNKTNKTILLVGETGSGKSTLINAMVNYTMGVKFEDNIWFEIVKDEKRSQSESQTSDVIVYEIFRFEDETLPYSLTIINTPGYGDTRGLELDEIISQRLFDLFRSENGVHEIDAVGLVMKASENRVSDRLMYIFDSVMSLFGKDMERNIIALITNSNGLPPTNVLEALEAAKIKCARNAKNKPVHFLFDNCQKTNRTEETEVALENAWRVTERGMKHLSMFLEESTPQKMVQTVDVMNTCVRLTACIQNLQERMMLIDQKQAAIQQTRKAVEKYKEEMEKNKNFKVEVDTVYKTTEKISSGLWGLFFYDGAVCCKVCEENCHYPGCTMAWYPKDCEVMSGGRCTSCTRKCPVSDHVKEDWIYVSKTKKVWQTKEDMKQKYNKNKAGSEEESSLLEDLENEMEEQKEEKNRLLEESYQHVVKLNQIALNVTSGSTYVCLDFLIDKLKEKGDTEKVRKLEEMKSQRKSDKGFMAAMRYGYDQFKGVLKTDKNKK